jgi:alanine racemase
VSGSALRHNARAICAHLETVEKAAKPSLIAAGKAGGPSMIAVVKADAYGHGLVPAARIFEDAGAALLAVTTAEEALELRAGGVAAEILVFLPPPASQVTELAASGIHVTVAGADDIARLQAGAEKAKRSARVHLKVDSGMGRLGVLPGQAVDVAKTVASTPWLELAGVYTHFARALEADASPTRRQFETFEKVLAGLAVAGIDPGLRHCANSAALLMDSRYWLDAVRPGTLLYGQYPAGHLPRALDLKDSWKLHVRVAVVREVPAGTAIGYGGEFVTRRATRLAVLPIGYSDGFTVAPASVNAGLRGVKSLIASLRPGHTGPTVTVRDRKAPVVGRVAMQLTSIDVTDIPGVAVGDIVTVPARRLMTSSRIPRIYEE